MTLAPKTLSPHVQAVLDTLVAAESHMTAAQIQKATGLDADLVQGAIKDLCVWGIVVRVGERWHKPGRFAHHSKLRATPLAQPEKTEPWRGVDWSVSTMRPGCLDHERVPSRRGDERVPHMPPQFFATGSVAQARER
ncbi:MAG: hypothetical protein RIR43_1400 [Pseudomonadota bacterium]|jgi:hypothetical protein